MKQTETAIGYLPHMTFVEMSEPCSVASMQKLADAVDSVLPGQIVLAIAEKIVMLHDIKSFCGFSGHELVHSETKDEKHHFWIRKG